MAAIFTVNDDFDYSIFRGSSCAFGVFDGVHRGHRFLLRCAMGTAHEFDGPSIALTFDIDPDEMFHADRLKKLMSNSQRIEELAASGVDAVVVLPFTREFAQLTPIEFLKETFGGHAPAHLHVGRDFHFGSMAAGNVEHLLKWAADEGTRIDAHDLKAADGEAITATRIRKLLAVHDLKAAEELLGRPFRLHEMVKAGRGEGADMGFATANLEVPILRQTLEEGVYAAYATVSDVTFKAAVSVGVSPSYAEESTASCEVHILDFDGDLYNKWIDVDFVHYLRPMIKFDSKDELIATVLGNIEWVRTNLTL